MGFSYKRQIAENYLEDHPIYLWESYGESFDTLPTWASYRIKQLYDKTHNKLSNILKAAVKSRTLDLSEYKEAVAKQKRNQILQDVKKDLLYTLKEEIDSANQAVKNMEDKILSITDHKPSTNDLQEVKTEMRYKEIRDYYANLDVEIRNQKLDEAFRNNDLTTIKALATSPIQHVNPDTLDEYRKQYAFKTNPELKEAYLDAKELARLVRKKAAAINSTADRIIEKEELDAPVNMQDHFNTFTPRDGHEQWAANRLIEREQKEQLRQESLKQYNQDNTGLSM